MRHKRDCPSSIRAIKRVNALAAAEGLDFSEMCGAERREQVDEVEVLETRFHNVIMLEDCLLIRPLLIRVHPLTNSGKNLGPTGSRTGTNEDSGRKFRML